MKNIFGEELKWTSTNEAKQIKGLPVGNYILRETKAPEGYTKAADVSFTVTDDMKLIGQKVTMKDAKTKVTISKTDITTNSELPGATLQIVKKAADGEGRTCKRVDFR